MYRRTDDYLLGRRFQKLQFTAALESREILPLVSYYCFLSIKVPSYVPISRQSEEVRGILILYVKPPSSSLVETY